MKRNAIIAGFVVVLLGALVGFYVIRKNGTKEPVAEESSKKRIVEPTNVISQEERPYLAIVPEADGRRITIKVSSIRKPATETEYTVEYQTGTLVQGFQGLLKLDSIPASETSLMGSCSAGGACTYHTDIKGGDLTTRFIGPENYSLKTEWKYFENKARESEFSSSDGKFQITLKALSSIKYLIIGQSSGVPEGYDGVIASEPYFLEASSSLKGEAELSIRSSQEGELTIIGWTGDTWKVFDTTQDGKMASATVDLLPLYVVITK
ncbi:MAG: hypothetical protein COY80_04425 [Candidatus Pacebacteria bacterium CG_4_10_14_0_8_um_filter_42_14]|nr:MAG: hypothetical protein COY80_04425 [Candidatus Pacebacteria bacterium CG_4_10_14_0_8_um_filter_42_14]